MMHAGIAKKYTFKGILSKEFADVDFLRLYSKTVKHFSMSALPIAGSFEHLMQSFPSVMAMLLSHCHLRSLAPVKFTPHITHLHLPGNHLSEIPQDLLLLKDTLESLDLSDCTISSIPDFFIHFKQLRNLELSNTLISKLPDNFGDLCSLESLTLKSTLLTNLPASFRQLQVDIYHVSFELHYNCLKSSQELKLLASDGVPWVELAPTLTKENMHKSLLSNFQVYKNMGKEVT